MKSKESEYTIDTWAAEQYESEGMNMVNEHFHCHHELVFNFSHLHLKHTCFGRICETSTPCILYRAPFVLHSTTMMSEGRYRRCRIDMNPRMLFEFDGMISLEGLGRITDFVIPVTDEQMEQFRPFLYYLCRRHKEKPYLVSRAEVGVLSAVMAEVCELVRDLPLETVSGVSYIQDIMDYIVHHIEEHPTVEKLVDRFFVSRAKLYRDFYRITNMSPHQYISAVQLSRAKLWIKEGLAVHEVAERCGFSQASPFIVMFRRATGMTPHEYRNC